MIVSIRSCYGPDVGWRNQTVAVKTAKWAECSGNIRHQRLARCARAPRKARGALIRVANAASLFIVYVSYMFRIR